jgi:hypothetical protein
LRDFHDDTFRKLLLIRHARRLEVELEGFFEWEIVYIANGTRTADSVKQIFGLCVTHGIMFPFNAQGKIPP